MAVEQSRFWGPLPTEPAGWSRRLGPLDLWIRVGTGEVTIAHRHGPDPLLGDIGDVGQQEPPPEVEHVRFVTSALGDGIELAPTLADRPVVVRPEMPLHLPSGESAELLVSTPLWVEVQVGEPRRKLATFPSFRPSDTWFGPSAREGEVCYASRSRARLRPTADASSLARAYTELTLHNRGTDALVVERINLPVPRLALYVAADGVHWTDGLTMSRQGVEGLAELSVLPVDPESGRQRIAEPHNPDSRNVFRRAVSSLLG